MAMLKVCKLDTSPLSPGSPASANRRSVTTLKPPPAAAGAMSAVLFQITRKMPKKKRKAETRWDTLIVEAEMQGGAGQTEWRVYIRILYPVAPNGTA
jgi:hypothetical protein